jgi:hypothetical protein
MPVPAAMEYRGERYPAAYNEEQFETLLAHTCDVFRVSLIRSGDLHFPTNKLCNAGFTSVYIHDDGTIYRCFHDRGRALGHVFENRLKTTPRPTRCHMRECFCFAAAAHEKLIRQYQTRLPDMDPAARRRLTEKFLAVSQPMPGYEDFWAGRERRAVEDTLARLAPRLHGKRILVRPAGATTQRVLAALPPEMLDRIIGIVDMYPKHSRIRVPGFHVVAPAKAASLKPDVILILHERYGAGMAKEYESYKERGVDVIVNPFPIYDEKGYKIF